MTDINDNTDLYSVGDLGACSVHNFVVKVNKFCHVSLKGIYQPDTLSSSDPELNGGNARVLP